MSNPLLQVDGLVKHFPVKKKHPWAPRQWVHAVNGVSLAVCRGETLALVGESGCGKSTVAKTVMQFHRPTSGTVSFDGQDLASLPPRELRRVRRDLQYVFQDPYSSLPSTRTVGDIIAEPLDIHKVGAKASRAERVRDLLDLVGLQAELSTRYPHEFSGGQRQRVGIARALALEPKMLLLDEPVSALDVSIQAQVINLLARLQQEMKLTYLFVAHDLALVRHLANRVAVMYLGRIVETGPVEDVFDRPQHPYTQSLLSAVPIEEPRDRGKHQRILLEGDLPSPLALPTGCAFRTRCWKADERCAQVRPDLDATAGTDVACHHPAPLAPAAVP
jgi:peptide/nickel transport system ATP-binding protein/oligopeptide transport system ATP-binding protein